MIHIQSIQNLIFSQSNFILKTILAFCFWIILFSIIKIQTYHPVVIQYDYSDSNFKILGLNIPANLHFAGEKVPHNDFEIKENLEKEFFTNKSWKRSSAHLFFKAQKWFPLIEPILKKNGIPDDFKYLSVIESHLSNAVSPMGAVGFWQLMPSTARNYGLVVNEYVDERLDVQKSTEAACKLIKEAHKYFNNWTLSAAAYNVGIGGIQKQMKKQNTTNYYDLLLNKETGSFIYRILAYKTLLSEPEHFGVKSKVKKTSFFPTLKTIKVDSSITDLKRFAKTISSNVITIKTFNPWLISDKLINPENIKYEIKIPKNKNIDLSIYFNDVFPQKYNTDTSITVLNKDTTIIIIDTLKK